MKSVVNRKGRFHRDQTNTGSRIFLGDFFFILNLFLNAKGIKSSEIELQSSKLT